MIFLYFSEMILSLFQKLVLGLLSKHYRCEINAAKMIRTFANYSKLVGVFAVQNFISYSTRYLQKNEALTWSNFWSSSFISARRTSPLLLPQFCPSVSLSVTFVHHVRRNGSRYEHIVFAVISNLPFL